jgi:hypothetical protein
MAFWIITPAADPEDARWQDHKRWLEVVVQAESAADARLEARELQEMPNAPPSGNEWPSGRSAFDDEKLYWVRRLDPSGDLLKVPPDRRIVRVM